MLYALFIHILFSLDFSSKYVDVYVLYGIVCYPVSIIIVLISHIHVLAFMQRYSCKNWKLHSAHERRFVKQHAIKSNDAFAMELKLNEGIDIP